MSLSDLKPVPPAWALEAGLPEPLGDQSFVDYVQMLGLDSELLLSELNDQTAELANLRLATRLSIVMPDAYDRYVATLTTRWATPERRREILRLGCVLFGQDFRRRYVLGRG